MKSISFRFLIMCGLLAVVPAQAQNLNALKNKAKNAIKQEVSKQTQQASGSVINAVEGNGKAKETEAKPATTSSQPTENTTPTPSQTTAKEGQPQAEKLKPSAAAIAADPGASEQTVREGYSKPTCEIRAAYEHLAPALFIHQPYYEGDNRYCYYVEADTDVKEFHDNCYTWFLMKAQKEYGVGWTRIDHFIGGLPGQGDRQVPYGEHTMHAGFAEVMADPGASNPFNHFLHACSILDASSEAGVHMRDYNREVKFDDGSVKLVEGESDRLARYRRMRGEVERYILSVSPFELLEFMADRIWERYQQRQQKNQFVVFDLFEYKEVVALMSSHPNVTKSETQAKCEAVVSKHQRQYQELNNRSVEYMAENVQKVREEASQMTMADLPKPGMSDAALEARFKSLAQKSQALSQGVDIKKVIIRDAGWNYDRNELGVVTARYKGAYVIYTVNGKTLMKEMSFKQPATGGGSFGDWQYRGIGTETRTITDWK